MEYLLQTNTIRTHRARNAQLFNQKWVVLSIRIASILTFSLSLFLSVAGNDLSWIVWGLFTLCITLSEWQRGDLANMEFGQGVSGNSTKVHELLQADTLSALRTDNPSAYELWQAMGKSEERYFFMNRFMIDDSFFEHLADKSPGSAKPIWTLADGFRQKYHLDGLTNASLFASLVLSVPNIDQLLKRLELDPIDIESAVPWMRDVYAKRILIRQRRNFGGIGRDWAYGYISDSPVVGA